MTAPDYAAEARRWLESWFGAEGAAFRPVASLTALLERLCGEAGSFAREQAQRERDGWHQAELNFKAQLSEARAEVERLHESYRLIVEQELNPAKEEACDQRERAEAAEAALEQAKAKLADLIEPGKASATPNAVHDLATKLGHSPALSDGVFQYIVDYIDKAFERGKKEGRAERAAELESQSHYIKDLKAKIQAFLEWFLTWAATQDLSAEGRAIIEKYRTELARVPK